MTKRTVPYVLAAASVLLTVASWRQWVPLEIIETLGFVTGAWCVWLTVRENVWNWPIGIANAVFYVVVFWRARLFADMGLQVIYVALGFLGWYWWLRGGEKKTALEVSRTPVSEWAWLVPLAALCTWGMTMYLRSVSDAAPFLDALTTVMSLVAQYLLTRKYVENWFVWISADVIYIGLYFWKGLPLTAVLYAAFLTMCVAGYREWSRSLARKPAAEALTDNAYAEAF